MFFYPEWYKSFYTVREITNSVTRQQDCLYVPKRRTDIGARSFDVIGPKMWNNLPTDITNTVSVTAFKSRLKCHLLERRDCL